MGIFFFFQEALALRLPGVISSAFIEVFDVLRRMVRRGLNVREEFDGAKILHGLCDYITERRMN